MFCKQKMADLNEEPTLLYEFTQKLQFKDNQ